MIALYLSQRSAGVGIRQAQQQKLLLGVVDTHPPSCYLAVPMSYLGDLLNLLYPPACLLCQAQLSSSSDLFCDTCIERMPRNGPPVCLHCGLGLAGAFDAQLLCSACKEGSRLEAVDIARAPWRYTDSMALAIQQFKYHRRWRIGQWLALAMASCARKSEIALERVDEILPVPMHAWKRRFKGFDHTAILTRMLAKIVERPYAAHRLKRSRWTPTQTRFKGAARFRNVRGAFHATSVRHKTLLLVDDVLTSGATVSACATALKSAGARHVFVLTAARAPSAQS